MTTPGEISKHEFRVNVRKLGLSEKQATTKELDELFESLDIDGSGALETSEMRLALKRLQEEVADVKGQYAYVQVRADSIRQVAAAYDGARLDTLAFEKAEIMLDEMRGGSVASRLGALLKSRNVKVSEIVANCA